MKEQDKPLIKVKMRKSGTCQNSIGHRFSNKILGVYIILYAEIMIYFNKLRFMIRIKSLMTMKMTKCNAF